MPRPPGQEPDGWRELESIVPLLKAADADAFRLFADVAGPVMLRYFRRKNPRHAEDLVQVFLMEVFVSLGSYRRQPGGSLRAWCYRIATNVEANWHRKRNPAEQKGDKMPELRAGLDGRPECGADLPGIGALDRVRAIQEAIAGLPEIDQEILYIEYFEEVLPDEERSHAAVARRLGMDAAAVRKRFERIRAKLRSVLEDPRLGARRYAAGTD